MNGTVLPASRRAMTAEICCGLTASSVASRVSIVDMGLEGTAKGARTMRQAIRAQQDLPDTLSRCTGPTLWRAQVPRGPANDRPPAATSGGVGRSGKFFKREGKLCTGRGGPTSALHHPRPSFVPGRVLAALSTVLRELSLRGLPSGRPPAAVGAAATVTGLTALAAGLGRQLRILREATFLIRDALTAFAAGDRGQLPVLRKAAF